MTPVRSCCSVRRPRHRSCSAAARSTEPRRCPSRTDQPCCRPPSRRRDVTPSVDARPPAPCRRTRSGHHSSDRLCLGSQEPCRPNQCATTAAWHQSRKLIVPASWAAQCRPDAQPRSVAPPPSDARPRLIAPPPSVARWAPDCPSPDDQPDLGDQPRPAVPTPQDDRTPSDVQQPSTGRRMPAAQRQADAPLWAGQPTPADQRWADHPTQADLSRCSGQRTGRPPRVDDLLPRRLPGRSPTGSRLSLRPPAQPHPSRGGLAHPHLRCSYRYEPAHEKTSRARAGRLPTHRSRVRPTFDQPHRRRTARPHRPQPFRPSRGARPAPSGCCVDLSRRPCRRLLCSHCPHRSTPGNATRPIHAGWMGLVSKYVRRRPTLPHSLPCSTIGAERLSFRVRNGAGRFPFAMVAVTLWRCVVPILLALWSQVSRCQVPTVSREPHSGRVYLAGKPASSSSWSSPRPISTGQLHPLLGFHFRPINPMV